MDTQTQSLERAGRLHTITVLILKKNKKLCKGFEKSGSYYREVFFIRATIVRTIYRK